MRTSNNTAEIFVDVSPDWKFGLRATGSHQTIIMAARSGLEQRSQTKQKAGWRISFENSAMTEAEWKQRLSIARIEYQSVCVVPMWQFGVTAQRSGFGLRMRGIDGEIRASGDKVLSFGKQGWNVAQVDTNLFQPGGWCLVQFKNGTRFQRVATAYNAHGDRFRAFSPEGGAVMVDNQRFMVAQHGGSRIFLLPPENDLLEEESEAILYPCVRCRRVLNNGDEKHDCRESRGESLIFETL